MDYLLSLWITYFHTKLLYAVCREFLRAVYVCRVDTPHPTAPPILRPVTVQLTVTDQLMDSEGILIKHGSACVDQSKPSNVIKLRRLCPIIICMLMKQVRDYRKYNVRLMSADWQRGSGRVTRLAKHQNCIRDNTFCIPQFLEMQYIHE